MNDNRNRLQKIDWSSIGITIALVIMFIFFSIFGNNFLSTKNVINIFRQVAVIGICAVGMTGVILTGGIDLSVGSVLGLTAVSAALFMADGMPVLLAVILSLLIGTFVGVVNAFVIDKLKMPPLIMTLGTNTALRGVIYLICGGMPVYGLPESYRFLGQGNILGIPTQVYILIIVFIVGYIIYNKTVFGREIYGLGGNPEATRLSGVNTSKTTYKIYIYEAFLASLAGLILLSRVNSGQPSLGDAYEMDIITAVVLGGVSVAGGEGKFSRVIIGVLFMGVLANGMNMMNIGDYWQRVVKGSALVIAVAIDLWSKQQKTKA
jgi:ribose transport system permease protein/inositol transport system permease protein